MNREFKFRVWNKDLKCFWKENEILGITIDGKIIAKLDEECSAILDKSKEDNIIQQFTGLKDEDGKDIYEGDIIAFNEIDRSVFEWDKDALAFLLSGKLNSYPTKYRKIVGNIFENKRLLEK